jgi:hypothetical protein
MGGEEKEGFMSQELQPDNVTVPDLGNDPVAVARQKCLAVHLMLQVNGGNGGCIQSQDPSPGTIIPSGGVVGVILSPCTMPK